jgi:hypothetical protein
MTKRERESLYKGLRKHFGSIKEVANRTGFTRDYVLKVLTCRRNNDLILTIASEVLLERESKRATTRQTINRNLITAKALAS